MWKISNTFCLRNVLEIDLLSISSMKIHFLYNMQNRQKTTCLLLHEKKSNCNSLVNIWFLRESLFWGFHSKERWKTSINWSLEKNCPFESFHRSVLLCNLLQFCIILTKLSTVSDGGSSFQCCCCSSSFLSKNTLKNRSIWTLPYEI